MPQRTADFHDTAGTLWRTPALHQMSKDEIATFGAWVCKTHGAICPGESGRPNLACPLCAGAEPLRWQPPLASRTTRTIAIGRNVRWMKVYA